MFDLLNRIDQCSICGHEYTSIHVEAAPGLRIYLCESCLEAASYNFIWICLNCGKVYMRPKEFMIGKCPDPVLKRAYALCRDLKIIQGINICIECDPEGIMNYVHPEAMTC